jgi:hypothetical protein
MRAAERRQFLAGGAAAAIFAAVGRADAHGFHASFTVIEHNARSGALEILHRIFVQDFELILTARLGEQTTLSDTPKSRQHIEDYLRTVFTLKTADGRLLKPDWVGMKIEVDTAFIYQEIPAPGPLAGLIVADQILTETNQGQVNSVNVTIGGKTQSAVFMIDDPPQTLMFRK